MFRVQTISSRLSRAAWVTAVALLAGAASAIGVGESAPPFMLPTASGESVTLDQLKGRVVYVDFWASWCGPCRRSFPWMNELQQKYGERGLTIVGVNVDKRRPDAQRFLAQTPATFTIVYDESGKTPAAYAVKGMPSSYLIDAHRQGRRRRKRFSRRAESPARGADPRAVAI